MTKQEAIEILKSGVEELDLPMLKPVYEMAIETLEKQAGIERALDRLEEEGKLADEEKERCARENPLQFDSAKGYATGIYNAIEIIKEELYGTTSAEPVQPKWKENMLQKFMRSE